MTPFLTCKVEDCLVLLNQCLHLVKGQHKYTKREGDFLKQVNTFPEWWSVLSFSPNPGSVLLSCLQEESVAKLWLLREVRVSGCMAPVAESSRATGRSPAVLSEFTVAGRALEDSNPELL